MDTPNKTNKKKLDTKWIIAAIVVPIVVAAIGYFAATSDNKQTPQNNTGISAEGDVHIQGSADIHVGDNIYTGITKEDFKSDLHNAEQRIIDEIRKTEPSQKRHRELEIELKSVRERLSNLQQSFEEERKRSEEAITALDKLKGEFPRAVIKKAKGHLRKGDKKVAKKLFDEIADKESPLIALARYQSGQLAEGDIDFAEAMRKYRIAVTLEDSNPDYLLAAGIMARTLGDYKEAQSWLEKLLQLRQKETTETAELAYIQNELAWLYQNMGKYEEAEPLYKWSLEIAEKSLGPDHPFVATTLNNLAKLYRQQGKYEEAELLYVRALVILRRTFPNGHPNIDTCENNYADMKQAMQSNQ